jgi:hypothetical protein
MLRRTALLAALCAFVPVPAAEKIRCLTAYFSRYDNTAADSASVSFTDAVTSASLQPPGLVREVANQVSGITASPLYPIIVKNLYPGDYDACLDRAVEEKIRRARPELRPIAPLTPFDVLFLGFPNWSYTLPMAVCRFLETAAPDCRVVAPFCVHGTGGLARTIRDLRTLLPKARILPALSLDREEVSGSEKKVSEWVRSSLALIRQ